MGMQVTAVFNAAVDCLGPNDRKLPQITGALPFLKRGIGIHHSGLLPLLKEVIELLFQNGLIKVKLPAPLLIAPSMLPTQQSVKSEENPLEHPLNFALVHLYSDQKSSPTICGTSVVFWSLLAMDPS